MVATTLSPSAHVDTFTRDHLPPPEQWPHLQFDLPELRYPARLNAAAVLLTDTVRRWGADRPCLITDRGTWTYGDLLRRASGVARVLVDDCGIVPGNRVLLRAPNNPELIACWYAVLLAGGVAVTTMPLLRPAELRAIGEVARVDLSIVDHRFEADLATADIGPYLVYGTGGIDDVMSRAATKPQEFSAVDTAADDVALLAFTSGTTGRPKATMHFHRDILANADTFSRHVLRPRADDVFAASPPIGFTFGLGQLVVFPHRVGAASLLLEKGTPDLLLPALQERGVTVMATAPTAYRAMLSNLPHEGLPGLRRCVSAGEPLPERTWSDWHEATGLKLIDGIGSTELLHIFVSAADDDIRPGRIGRAIPGFSACVLDASGAAVPDGEVGLLAVRGPTGCRYLADPRQADYVRDGWNLPGDAVSRDADGYFTYHSRADDMIISAGFNISGAEVDAALLSHPDVLECAAVGAPDPERTMVVKAYVVLRSGVPADATALAARADELIGHCKKELASYKAPRSVEFLAALPRTSTGKVQRFKLRDAAG